MRHSRFNKKGKVVIVVNFVVGDVVVPRRVKYYHGADIPRYTVLQYSSRYSMLLLRGQFFSCPQWYPAENFRKANFYQPELMAGVN